VRFDGENLFEGWLGGGGGLGEESEKDIGYMTGIRLMVSHKGWDLMLGWLLVY